MSTHVIKVAKQGEVAGAVDAAARTLREGGLVGFPTETVYGLAASAANPAAMARLRDLKNRPKHPFSVHLPRPGDVKRYVRKIPESARRLIERALPGPITLVLPTGGKLPDRKLQKGGLHETLCKNGWIGLRAPDDPIAQGMLQGVEDPVVAPSANLAGAPSPRTAKEVLDSLDGRIELLIDAGPTRYGVDSTVVRCDATHWRILREGVYDEKAIRRILLRKILFVCTGNTCRSPIAAGITKKMLADRFGCSVSGLRKHGVEVFSAGVAAGEGRRASPEAVHAAKCYGANIASHRSRKLTPQLINAADMIFCMTDLHVDAVCGMVRFAAGKVLRLDPSGAVPDPIGGGPEVYSRAAEQIQGALEACFKKDIL